jgi:hypothetical protein
MRYTVLEIFHRLNIMCPQTHEQPARHFPKEARFLDAFFLNDMNLVKPNYLLRSGFQINFKKWMGRIV